MNTMPNIWHTRNKCITHINSTAEPLFVGFGLFLTVGVDFFGDRSTEGTGGVVCFFGGQEYGRDRRVDMFFGDRSTGETEDLVRLDKPMDVRRTSILRIRVRRNGVEACPVRQPQQRACRLGTPSEATRDKYIIRF